MSEPTAQGPRGTSLRAAIGSRLPRGSLGRNALVVFIPTGVVGVLGITRDAVLARQLGLGLDMDTWVVGLAVMGYISSIFRGSIEAVGVPLVVDAAHGRTACDPGRTARHVLAIAVAFALGSGLVVAIVHRPLAHALAGSNPAAFATLQPVIVLLGSVAAGFMIAEAGPRAVLQANQRYALAAIAPLLPSVVVLGYLLSADAPSVLDIATAMAVGTGLELLLVGLPAVTSCHGGRPKFAGLMATARDLVPRVGSMGLASVVFGCFPLIDLWFASRLGEGKASTLSLAGRVPLGVAALLWTALATPMLTDLSIAASQGGPPAVHAVVARRVRRIFLLTATVSASLAVLSIPMALVLYRGQQVDFDASVHVGVVQIVYCLFLVPSTIGVVLVRAYQAMNRTTELVVISCIGLISNVVLDAAAGAVLGVAGLALATVLVYTITSTLLWARIARSAPGGTDVTSGRSDTPPTTTGH
jgi:putative peptidoglycan lipid II flippase